MIRALLVLLCVSAPIGALEAAGSPVDQATLDQAETFFFDGLAAYRAETFQKAVALFEKAYALTPHRDLLFNIARAHERAGDKASAVRWFRAYLATTPADETAIIHRIKQLGGDPTPLALAEQPKKVAKKGDGPKVKPGPPARGAGPWPWVAAGLGVAAVGVGTGLGLGALDDAAAARDESRRDKAEDLKASAESNALFADIAFGVGAVAVGAAVFLLINADAPAESAGRVDVGASADGLHIGWSARF